MNVWIGCDLFMIFKKLFIQIKVYIHPKTKLSEVYFKSIRFEKIDIIRCGVVHAIKGIICTAGQHSPPPVPFTKSDWSVHGFPSFFSDPFLSINEKNKCSSLNLAHLTSANSLPVVRLSL